MINPNVGLVNPVLNALKFQIPANTLLLFSSGQQSFYSFIIHLKSC